LTFLASALTRKTPENKPLLAFSGSCKNSADYPQGDSNECKKTREKRQTAGSTARQTAHFSPDLQRVIDAWDLLSDAARQSILELADAAPDTPEECQE
jgi:hypothetical protein